MSSQPSGRVTILLVCDQPHHFRIREFVFCSDELIAQKDSVSVSDHRSCWIMNCNLYPLGIGQFLSMDSEKNVFSQCDEHCVSLKFMKLSRKMCHCW